MHWRSQISEFSTRQNRLHSHDLWSEQFIFLLSLCVVNRSWKRGSVSRRFSAFFSSVGGGWISSWVPSNGVVLGLGYAIVSKTLPNNAVGSGGRFH